MSLSRTFGLFLALIWLFLAGCGMSSGEIDFHKSTADSFKQLWENYDYMFSLLPYESQNTYAPLRDSFRELIRSGVMRTYEFADVKEFEEFLSFLKSAQTQTQK